MSKKALLFLFKFHYDSINSVVLNCHSSVLNVHLNSIMILLIRTVIGMPFQCHIDLNSIMILLIFSFLCATVIMILFKFHYDSINCLHRQQRF